MAEAEPDPEDEEELAQWMPICDDCDNPVEHYCTTCGDKLCTGCKDHHLSRRKNRDHQVVPYSAGMRAAGKSRHTCSKHPGELYQLYCKPCKSPVCTPCIAQSHSGHDFISLPDALSVAREKAISNLEVLTKKIRPIVQDECEMVKKSEDKALQTKSTIEQEMGSSAKQLHAMLDKIHDENRKRLLEMMEENTLSVLRKQKKDTNDRNRSVEKAIKDYEDKLRSSDPIDLLSFMRGRESDEVETSFLPTVLDEVPLPVFQTIPISQDTLRLQFGSLTFSDNVTPSNKMPMPTIKATDLPKSVENARKEEKSRSLSLMTKPEKLKESTISTDYFQYLGKIRLNKSGRMWISAAGGTYIVLVDREGNVIHNVDAGCQMFSTSGIYCTDVGELIFGDAKGKQIKKISTDFRVTSLFMTGMSGPRGISQLQSGDWVVCMADEGILRVYDGAGIVAWEIGKGHLQRPFYVTVNKVNDDICVSDNGEQVVVFSSNDEKRFTYKGDGNGFNPHDLCCDQLGNILITDYINQCVHVIDRNGHFLQYLVSGEETISCPITIDIDDKGHAWVGENITTKVKAFKYLK